MGFLVCFTMSSFQDIHHKVPEGYPSLFRQVDKTPPPKLSTGDSSRGILEAGKSFSQLLSVSNPFLHSKLWKNSMQLYICTLNLLACFSGFHTYTHYNLYIHFMKNRMLLVVYHGVISLWSLAEGQVKEVKPYSTLRTCRS